MRNVDGSLCQLVNDNGMTNITVFDYSKPIGQKIWLDEVCGRPPPPLASLAF